MFKPFVLMGLKTYEEMRQENFYNILNIKLFLMITIILLSMFIGDLFAEAQETDVSDNWQYAELLIPNGDYKSNTFSFSGDLDWYQFYADQGSKYLMFTRPVKEKNFPEIVMRLFADPSLGYIAYNRKINKDGSAFIEWLCRTSGVYFIKVRAYDPSEYGDMAAYTMHVTSIDYQEPHTIIRDVPDYSQSDFGYSWDCKVVAAACILGYWDNHGYDFLVDLKPDRTEDVIRLASELYGAMVETVKERGAQIVLTDENVWQGIQLFCNTPKYGNNYNFAIEYSPIHSFSQVTEEIENGRPVLLGVKGNPLLENHWIVTVGYLKTNTTEWTINHDNWNNNIRDIYIEWDGTAESIITIHPPDPYIEEITKPSYIDLYPIIPSFSFGVSPFAGLITLPVTTWLSPLNTGYSNPFNLSRREAMMSPGYQSFYNYQPPIPWSIQLGSFLPYDYKNSNSYNSNRYNSVYGYNFTDWYNDAAGYSDIISNPIQGTNLGSDLSLYSFLNVPSQDPAALFNSLFVSPYQMLFTDFGLFPNNVFSPFPSFPSGLFWSPLLIPYNNLNFSNLGVF